MSAVATARQLAGWTAFDAGIHPDAAMLLGAVYEFITGPLLDNPRRVGKPLDAPLAPLWSARRGTYRVLYAIDDTKRLVEVAAVGHRADVYRP